MVSRRGRLAHPVEEPPPLQACIDLLGADWLLPNGKYRTHRGDIATVRHCYGGYVFSTGHGQTFVAYPEGVEVPQ